MAVLHQKELTRAQKIIDDALPGIYELKHLYGSMWQSISSPTVFGGNFKETVQAGHLRNIRLLSPKTNNHQTYEVHFS
jgi:hypothetical protein